MKIALKIISLLLALALCVGSYLGIGPLSGGDAVGELPFEGMVTAEPFPGTLREALTDEGRELYDIMAAAILACEPSVHIPSVNYTQQDLSDACLAFYYDHPEVFWYDYGGTAMIINSTGVTVSFTYFAAGEELEAMKTRFSAALNTLTAAANGAQDEWYKALSVHDALIACCSYDATLSGANIHNAYGALVDGSAVCDGYSRAFKCAMDSLGLACRVVPGEVTLVEGVDPEAHAWNLVQVDGQWISVDVTWDELDFASYSSDVPTAASHAYYGLGDEQMAVNHTVTTGDISTWELPVSTERSWYGRVGRHSNDGSDIQTDLANALIASLADGNMGVFEIRLATEEGERHFFEEGFMEVIYEANEILEESGDERAFDTDAQIRYYILDSRRGCYLFTCQLA